VCVVCVCSCACLCARSMCVCVCVCVCLYGAHHYLSQGSDPGHRGRSANPNPASLFRDFFFSFCVRVCFSKQSMLTMTIIIIHAASYNAYNAAAAADVQNLH
jgi:hypothetical protein